MSYPEESQNLITQKVLPKFFIALLVTTLGMGVGIMFIPEGIAIFASILAILLMIVAFIAKGFKRKREDKFNYESNKMTFSMKFVYFLALLLGIGMYPIIMHYSSKMGVETVFIALAITTALFGSLALYAYKSSKDFTGMGAFLFFSLFAIIIMSIVGLFIQLAIFHIVLSILGILIFSGYILYDISCMKQAGFTEEDVPMAVLDLLLDFINIFLDVLRLISYFKD